jgi:hypothetical protein
MFTDFIGECRAVKLGMDVVTPIAGERIMPALSIPKARRVAATA